MPPKKYYDPDGMFVPPPASLWLTALTARKMVENRPSGVRQGSSTWTATTLLHAPSTSFMVASGADVHDVSTTLVTVLARSTQTGPWSKSMRPPQASGLYSH